MSGVRPVKSKKASGKAKADPKKRTRKAVTNAGEKETETDEIEKDDPKKKRRVDKEAKARLDALKLQTDMVHMQQKWTCRIKTVNIEVTTSIKASEEFDFLEGLLGYLVET